MKLSILIYACCLLKKRFGAWQNPHVTFVIACTDLHPAHKFYVCLESTGLSIYYIMYSEKLYTYIHIYDPDGKFNEESTRQPPTYLYLFPLS